MTHIEPALLRPHFQRLAEPEKAARMEALAGRFGLTFQGLAAFSRWGQSCTTGVFTQGGRTFHFVPGDTVTLGWERFAMGLGEGDLAELTELFEECAIQSTPEGFLREELTPVRQADIPPMLVSPVLEEIGWEPVSLQDPRLLAHPDWLEDFQQYMRSGGGGLNLSGCARLDRVGDQWQAFLYHNITYPELKEQLKRQGHALPTADEWAYLCGGGCRTLFPWGDGFKEDMHLLYFEFPGMAGAPYDMKEPNFFGLSIAYDPYQQEVVEADTLTTCGGDGGCSICGGSGPFLGFLPCSPHHCPEIEEDDILNDDFHFFRPIIRLD